MPSIFDHPMTRSPDDPILVHPILVHPILETWLFTFYTDSFPLHNILLAPGKWARGGFMHRCGSGFLLTLAISVVAAFTGCLGKSSSNPGNGGVSSITLNPGSTISLETGGTQGFSASAKDALGKPILGLNIQFVVESGTTGSAPLSVASNGAACAGTWNPSVTQCSAGTPGIAYVHAVANGVSSPKTEVYVHQHVASIQIIKITPPPPPQQEYDCFYHGQTWQFEAIAYNSNGVDITGTVGPMSWSSSNASVVTPTPTVFNQVQTTARTPGITQLFASVSGTTSAPYPYTTCLIKAIYLQIGGEAQAGNSITVNNGGSVPITATAIDTLFGIAPGDTTPLTSPPLTWSTTNPEVAAFSNTTNTSGSNSATARANLGGATLTASCSPPSCNIGVLPGLPIYASDGTLPNGTEGYGTISVDVTSASTSKTPTYTAWAATTDCANAVGCTSALFSLAPTTSGTNAVGAIVGLPRTPNSMMFNHQSSARVYIGTNEGLMYVDVSAANPSVVEVSSPSTPCNASLCGKVLTISNDGKLVVVSDTVSTPRQVYIFNGSGATAPVDLIIPGETATAAAFSPDQLKLFILTNLGNMYIYSTVDALTSVSTFAPGTDVEFSSDGSFAYVAGSPASAVSAFSTCSLPDIGSVDIGSVTTSSTPLKLFPSPVIPPPFEQNGFLWTTQNILALEQPPNTNQGTSIELLAAQFRQDPIPYQNPLQLTCNPPVIPPTTGFTKGPKPFDLGQGNFTPIYSQLVNDGAEMIVVGHGIPAVLLFNVSDGTTRSVSLSGSPATGCPQCAGNSFPLSASASTDGSQVYVAACDQYPNNDQTKPCTAGSVHIVNTCGVQPCNAPPALGEGDFQQVPYVNINDANNPNMCNNQGGTNAPVCLPNLVAIKPQ
jgi:hypothetical protein